jgi:transcriptional regulator with XRE-family HTH domain
MSFIETKVTEAPWNLKLKILRILNGLKISEAADLCGTDESIYCNWEKGNHFPRRNSVRAIQRAFNLSDEATKEIFG